MRSAIAARQKPGLASEAGDKLGDQDGERRFSRAAGREISDAYDRDQRAIGLRTAQSRLCDRSDERADRGKKRRLPVRPGAIPPIGFATTQAHILFFSSSGWMALSVFSSAPPSDCNAPFGPGAHALRGDLIAEQHRDLPRNVVGRTYFDGSAFAKQRGIGFAKIVQ